ncbi:MAG: ABC transporter ATP-binding protein [Ruminococcus sp.]|nr:ABC transporter ATP-binding protein [Ruminococcus sp.]
MNIFEVKDLSKSYKDLKAVDNISFSVEKGKIYGILGPNGAGKSTTIKMISGLLKPDSGKITYEDGQKITKWSKNIGLVPQEIAIYSELTAEENLRYFASLYKISGAERDERVRETLKFVGLLDVKDKRSGEYSGGMKRRLNIACALIHLPKLIIMDEPTVGIDPQSRNYILETVLELNKKGTSVIYTSHYMEEVEKICDRIVILDHGKVILNDDKINIKNRFLDIQKIMFSLSDNVTDELKSRLSAVNGVTKVEVSDNELTCSYKVSQHPQGDIMSVITESGFKINNMSMTEQDLETVFLSLTGKELRE